MEILRLQANPAAVPLGGAATVSGNVANATSWFLTSTLRNSFDLATGSSNGEFVRTYAANRPGTDTVTLTAEGKCGPVEEHVVITVDP